MSGKRRGRRHPKKYKKQYQTTASDRQNAVKSARKVRAEPSTSVNASEAGSYLSRHRRKIAAFLTTPAVISGFAGAVPQVVINAVQQVIHAATARSPNAQKPPVVVQSSSAQKPAASGGEYYFSKEWQSGGHSPITNQTAAYHMAAQVVNIALQRAGWLDCDAASRHRYIQWILAGNMTPSEAAEVLAENPQILLYGSNNRSINDLVHLVNEHRSIAGAPAVFLGRPGLTIRHDGLYMGEQRMRSADDGTIVPWNSESSS